MDRTRVPERTATPEELREDARRFRKAQEGASPLRQPTNKESSSAAKRAAERVEEIRRCPCYVETEGKPPRTASRTKYELEWSGVTFPLTRDKIWPLAQDLVKYGATRRTRVFRVVTTVVRQELRGWSAFRGPKTNPGRCAQHAANDNAAVIS